MSLKKFLIIFVSVIFFNVETSDSKKKSSNSSRAAQQISTKAKSSVHQKDKQELKLTEKSKRQTEEEMLAAYQAEAEESRKDLKKVELKPKLTSKDIAELKNLFIVIENNHTSDAEFFISRLSSDKIDTMDNGETALLCAARKNCPHIVKLLLDKGANPNIKGYNGVTALMLGVAKDYLDVVKKLLAFKDIDLDLQTKHGSTALMQAVIRSKLDMAELLLDKGADTDIQDNYGATALMFAVKKLDKENKENIENLVKTSLENISSLYQDSLIFKNLVSSLCEHNPYTTKMLLEANANSDIQNKREMVKMLLREGADPNIQMNNGATALTFAVLQDQWDVVKMLLEAGANINIQMNNGDSVLDYVVQKGDFLMVEFLLSKNPSIDLRRNDGFTPLMIAYYYYAVSSAENYKRIIELLEDYGFIITQEEQEKINFYLDQARSNLENISKKESLNPIKRKKIDKEEKELDIHDTDLIGAQERSDINEEEITQRVRLLNLFDLEKRELKQVQNIRNAEIKQLKNLIKQFEEEKRELEALVKSNRSEKELSKPKTFENVIQEKGGLTDHQKNVAKFHFDKILELKNINSFISQEDDLEYSFKRDFFDLKSVSFDWSHIINVAIGWEYDFKTNLYTPSFEGGHCKETIDKLVESGLVKKISEKKWKNGCAEYVLENIWTGKRFSKTVFPNGFDISKIYGAITQGKIKDKKEISEQGFLTPKIEMVIEYNNILIKAFLVKKFFGYEIITAFPVEKIENTRDLPSASVVQNLMSAASPAAKFF